MEVRTGAASEFPVRQELVAASDVSDILRNPTFVPDPAVGERFIGSTSSAITFFLALRGREHDRRRRDVIGPFTSRAVHEWQPRIDETASRLAAALPNAPQIEIAQEFARPLAAATAAEFTGVQVEGLASLTELARRTMDARCHSHRRLLAAIRILRISQRAIEGALDGELPVGSSPHRALVDTLVSGDIEPADVLGVLMPMLTAGVELTARSVLACFSGADGGDPLAMPIGDVDIDRAIARAGILPTVDRICTSECEVGDLHLTVGERLRLRLAGDADGSSGLPFGLGAHFCPGAAWVRAVSRAGVIALADRLRGYAVASVEYADISQQPAGPVALRMRASNSCPR